MFDFGVFTQLLEDPEITDIDSNGNAVYIQHSKTGIKRVMDLEAGYLESMLNRLCNYPQIDKEFNHNNPILDGTMDGLRIHAVHKSVMPPYGWLSIRRNPIKLVYDLKSLGPIYDLIRICIKLKWSLIYGGERGSGKTQMMRSTLAELSPDTSVTIIADEDEMHMQELFPKRLIGQYIINDVVDYTDITASVLRDHTKYVVFSEVRDSAVDDLLKVLSSSSRIYSSIHVKEALLMPQRMIQLSQQKNDEHLLTTIHDYVQMCIVPVAEEVNGKINRYIGEIAMFWNDEDGVPRKKLIYKSNGSNKIFYEIPDHYKKIFNENNITLDWRD